MKDSIVNKQYKCSNKKCSNKSFYIEMIEKWATYKGRHYCFSCSIKDNRIDWKNSFLTFRTAELERRENEKKDK
jgi:hypothetical protein